MREKAYTVDEIRNIVKDIAEAHGVERAYLFGSYVKGNPSPQSDLDIRIDRGRIQDLVGLSAFYAALEEALGLPVDLVTTDSLDAKRLCQIGKEEMLIFAAS